MKETLLLIDKPKGITSFDVIRELRKKLGVRKMGHAGTLDPLASGLMIIGIGENTKELARLVKLPKTYEVSVRLGERTTTGDLEGEVIEKKEVGECNKEKIQEVLKGMVGEHNLPVPRYSAIKVDGEELYKKARRGEDFEPPTRSMEIYSIDLKDSHICDDTCIFDISVDVSSGAYIRSLAEEIGKRLGYPATVQELRRTKIGEFDIKDANTLDAIHTSQRFK